ncbi:MAG: hypothetical protein WCB12_04585 [Bryobacteraceae bacterium]
MQNAIRQLWLGVVCSATLLAQNTPPGTRVIASTVPSNGDVNPYGVAIVPETVGDLTAGNILVSNFNNSSNLQGTGTTIVQITPRGSQSLFAQIDAAALPGACPGGIGLTTALAVLRGGWVVVGSLPTTDGTSATAQAGCLLVLDAKGSVAETIANSSINGPWDMTAVQQGDDAILFVTNVLNGTVAAGGSVVDEGTVVRITLEMHSAAAPTVESIATIGSGFAERTDPAALVIGPTGLGLSHDGTLYVADSLNNRIAAIPDALRTQNSAGTGKTVKEGHILNDPLGLAVGIFGDILTVNGNNGFLVITTPRGDSLGAAVLDSSGTPPGAGALFGLAVGDRGLYYVDDATNTLNIFL